MPVEIFTSARIPACKVTIYIWVKLTLVAGCIVYHHFKFYCRKSNYKQNT